MTSSSPPHLRRPDDGVLLAAVPGSQRRGVAAALEVGEIGVAGWPSTGEELLAAVRELAPGAVILGDGLDGRWSAVDLARALRSVDPTIGVVLLVEQLSTADRLRLYECGAAGIAHLTSPAGPPPLLAAVCSVMAGEGAVDDCVVRSDAAVLESATALPLPVRRILGAVLAGLSRDAMADAVSADRALLLALCDEIVSRGVRQATLDPDPEVRALAVVASRLRRSAVPARS